MSEITYGLFQVTGAPLVPGETIEARPSAFFLVNPSRFIHFCYPPTWLGSARRRCLAAHRDNRGESFLWRCRPFSPGRCAVAWRSADPPNVHSPHQPISMSIDQRNNRRRPLIAVASRNTPSQGLARADLSMRFRTCRSCQIRFLHFLDRTTPLPLGVSTSPMIRDGLE